MPRPASDPTCHPAPPPSEAARLEVAMLRAMLGLPTEEGEPGGRAPPETTQPDKPIPPDQDTTNQP